MTANIIQALWQFLTESVDPQTLKITERFFKPSEEAKTYGIRMKEVSKIAKYFSKEVRTKPKAEVFELSEQLWLSGYLEEAVIACDWAYAQRENYESADFEVFEHWLSNYVDNWASCDTLCNHTIGTFVKLYPQDIDNLKTWTQSDNRWVKRGAVASLIIPVRKGLFLTDIFEIATALLTDSDHMVQKGYGWMLKAASESHCKAVFDFVVKHKAIMPRMALRYAIEKMPEDLKAKAMKK